MVFNWTESMKTFTFKNLLDKCSEVESTAFQRSHGIEFVAFELLKMEIF